MMRATPLLIVLALAGCNTPLFQDPGADSAAATDTALPRPPEVAAAVLAPPPPPAARTAEEFDTTTAEQRAAATATPAAVSETRLGTTIATLGPPGEPGLWLETGLVTEIAMGRVEYPAAGTSVTLELRPSGGDPGAGSQISLAAMRLLGAPLTGLPELVVWRQ